MTDAIAPSSSEGVLLVVDDDEAFRKILVRTLTSRGYNVREAENGLVGKTIFDLARVEIRLVISDIRMPELDGVQLLKHIRTSSKVPVVLMTGFSEILEVQQAYEMGASEFLTKPFRVADIFKTVEACLNPKAEIAAVKTPETERKAYCPIHIDEFITTSKLRTDIYVRLSEEKYVKVAHRDDVVPVDRLRVYKEKKVEHLFVTIEDFATYVDFTINFTSMAVKNKALSKEQKIRLLRHTAETIVGKCFADQLDPELFKPAQRMVEDTLNLASEDPMTLELLTNLQSHSDKLYAHSVAVSLFSCLVARAHGWTAANTLFRVAMGGLFHDIGLKELPSELLRKNRIQQSPEEVKQMETHPARGRDLVVQLRSLPEDISQIVLNHHEAPTGTGYPHGLSGDDIHPLAKLIGTVDRFVDLIMPITDDTAAMTPTEGLDRLGRFHIDQIDVNFFRRLMEVFNHSLEEKANAG